MSLSLDLGTKPEGTVAKMFDAQTVHVGDIEISTEDFCQLVIYVLTNVDLVAKDPRFNLRNQIVKLQMVEGHNPGGIRLGYGEFDL